jgi:hypothetical protein
MELTDDQKTAVRKWVTEGLGLSDIQKRLQEEFKLSITYMDVRFLLIDLELQVKEKVRAPDMNLKSAPAPAAAPGADAGGAFGDEAAGGPGGVTVEVDRLMKPGAIVSGSVTFSDGVHSSWSLDQMGRLALDPGREGYRPSQEDILAFQEELRRVLQERGF